MNIQKRLLVPAMALASALVLANTSNAGSPRTSDNIRYVGDDTARFMCRAIVRDDAPELRRLLKQFKRTLVRGYAVRLTGPGMLENFTCNGLSLAPFSESVDAHQVSRFLETGSLQKAAFVASDIDS